MSPLICEIRRISGGGFARKVFNKSDVMRKLYSQYRVNRVISLHEIISDVF